MNFQKVAAVIVTYNRKELLQQALDSIKNQTYKVNQIFVVNNNSNDGTKEYLDSLEDIVVIHMKENLGGAGGFHYGVKAAAESANDFIWIMDDDAIASAEALSELMKASNKLNDDKISWGFLCSKVMNDLKEPMNLPVISKKISESGYPRWSKYIENSIVEVDKSTFVSVLVKKEIVRKLGLPIKEMFIWGDDTEYTWRISNKYPCFFVGNSQIIHRRMNGKSLSIILEDSAVRLPWYSLLIRNNTYNFKKHGNRLETLKYFVINILLCLKILIKAKDRKIYRVWIQLKGMMKSFTFNPKIKFPD